MRWLDRPAFYRRQLGNDIESRAGIELSDDALTVAVGSSGVDQFDTIPDGYIENCADFFQMRFAQTVRNSIIEPKLNTTQSDA